MMTDLSKLARKITWVLFANQSLASAGFIAAATLNSIIGTKLGGSASYAGVPSAVYLVGAALAASAWGYIMDRIGRRNGMVSGLIIGVIGTALVLFAILISSFFLFLIGMVLITTPPWCELLRRRELTKAYFDTRRDVVAAGENLSKTPDGGVPLIPNFVRSHLSSSVFAPPDLANIAVSILTLL
jgi:MFS family permease